MNLVNSNVDPAIRDRLAVTATEKGDDLEHIDMIKARLSRYNALKQTHYYRVISDLIDPTIKHLECELAKPRGAFPATPTDVLQEQRAEWRGMLAVWVQLRDEPELLANQLAYHEKRKEQAGKDNKSELTVDKYV